MARHKVTTIVFRVTIEAPRGSTKQQCEGYVRAAVQSHCGGLDPADPMFELNRDCVRVSLMESHDYYRDTGNTNGNKRNTD